MALRPFGPNPPRPVLGRETVSNEDTPAAPGYKTYSPDQITLYGVRLNVDNRSAYLPLDRYRLKLAVVPYSSEDPVDPKLMPIAIIYGYAFEGFSYRFDKPKIFVFEPNITEAPARGGGFEGLDYSMWQITQKTKVVELATSFDLAEEIVLISAAKSAATIAASSVELPIVNHSK